MKHFMFGAATFLLALLYPGLAQADDGGTTRIGQCQIDQSVISRRTDDINTAYQERFARLSEDTAQRAQEIEDDAPDPNTAEAVVKFDLDVGSKKQDFAMDLPQVTMRLQGYSMNIPQTKMASQTWKYKLPAVRMKMRCVDGPPEVVCGWKMKRIGFIKTKVWECSTRKGKQMCTEIPETYMNEVETILDVPQVTMAKQEIKTSMPVVTMKRADFSFNVPTFTVRNLTAEMREIEDRSTELGEETQAESEALAESMETEIRMVTSEIMAAQFACNRAELEGTMREKLSEFDNMIAVMSAARDKAAEVGAQAMVDANVKAINDIIAARDAFRAEMENAIAGLSPTEQSTLDKALEV